MIMERYRLYRWKGACYRIKSPFFDVVTREVRLQRALLEKYIEVHPGFASSMKPVDTGPDAPPVARTMARAAAKAGVGPMAAVAGAFAQFAVEAALRAGAEDTVVDNGGDIYIASHRPVTVGIYPGEGVLKDKLAIRLEPPDLPAAVCSSSSRMGHSASFGDCDLACVVSDDGPLADAVATAACNMVQDVSDIERVLGEISGIGGVRGVLIVKDDRVGIAGDFPPLVRNAKDPASGGFRPSV
jgi:ApbE superfamily uncharacterized protein (UPF0280 family)